MPLEIRRPGDALGEKPRLSRFGKGVVAAVLIIALAASGLVYSVVQAAHRRSELAVAVLQAVDRGRLVCTNALSAVGADNQASAALEGYFQEIETKTDVRDKAAAAQEMITYVLSQVGGDQAQVDELVGARNRILLALQQYENPR